ncbi:MAG: PIN domain nuclease [Euzebya sp.]
MTWLIDKSAYVRLNQSPDREEWMRRIDRGLVHIATVTRLEIGYSMRSARELTEELGDVLSRLVSTYTSPRAEDRAVQVQEALTESGHHRGPSIPDLIIAAVGEIHGHTVLHMDRDFELITQITGQPIERLVA